MCLDQIIIMKDYLLKQIALPTLDLNEDQNEEKQHACSLLSTSS